MFLILRLNCTYLSLYRVKAHPKVFWVFFFKFYYSDKINIQFDDKLIQSEIKLFTIFPNSSFFYYLYTNVIHQQLHHYTIWTNHYTSQVFTFSCLTRFLLFQMLYFAYKTTFFMVFSVEMSVYRRETCLWGRHRNNCLLQSMSHKGKMIIEWPPSFFCDQNRVISKWSTKSK